MTGEAQAAHQHLRAAPRCHSRWPERQPLRRPARPSRPEPHAYPSMATRPSSSPSHTRPRASAASDADLWPPAGAKVEGAEHGVIRSETSFGGGKTHGLIAVYHLATGARPLNLGEFIDPGLLPGPCQIAAVVATRSTP